MKPKSSYEAEIIAATRTLEGSIDEKMSVEKYPTDRDQFGRFLTCENLVERGVEVGVYKGEFAKSVLTQWPGEYVMVDLWANQPNGVYNEPINFQNFEPIIQEAARVAEAFGRVTMLRMDSVVASKRFQDQHFDWVYIDANHAYENCMADIISWWPKLRVGGIIGGHDWGFVDSPNYKIGVAKAVTDFAHTLRINYSVSPKCSSWWIRKRSLQPWR